MKSIESMIIISTDASGRVPSALGKPKEQYVIYRVLDMMSEDGRLSKRRDASGRNVYHLTNLGIGQKTKLLQQSNATSIE